MSRLLDDLALTHLGEKYASNLGRFIGGEYGLLSWWLLSRSKANNEAISR